MTRGPLFTEWPSFSKIVIIRNIMQPQALQPQPPILHLSRHTGMLFAFQMQPLKYQARPEQLRPVYVKIQRHCILFGWWSLFSLFLINPITILFNAYSWWNFKRKYTKYLQLTGLPQNPVG